MDSRPPLRCRLGRHVWVRVRAPHGQPPGPETWACSECGRTRTVTVPLGMLGG